MNSRLALCIAGLIVGLLPLTLTASEERQRNRAGASPGLPGQPSELAAPLRAPKAPRAADSSSSGGVCAGLKDYEIVRSASGSANCSTGNVVTGGSCDNGLAGVPNNDGSAWQCPQGGLAIAICANVCSRLPPPVGACCTGSQCSEVSADECLASAGVYKGDGTPCDADTCLARGACCLEEFNCIEDQTQQECEDQAGTYVGDDLACDSDEAEFCFDGM